MVGPGLINPDYGSGYCWWQALASGSSPYTYSWYRDGSLVSSAQDYGNNWFYSNYNFTLILNVSDAQGHALSDTATIYWSANPM